MSLSTPVFLRADGSSKIGLGHVHRLLALAEMMHPFFDCTFMIRSPLPGVKKLILDTCPNLLELDADISIEKELEIIKRALNGKEIVVLDGYNFDTSYQEAIKSKGSALVCIDDIFKYHFVSDVIINPSGGIPPEAYSKQEQTKLLTGPLYALLKKPFRMASKAGINRSADEILICMGGADPLNNTVSALKRCLEYPFEIYNIIVGEGYLHSAVLQQEINNTSRKVKVFRNLAADEIVAIMQRAAVAVCSASGISYEYLSVRGELYIQQTADNQFNLHQFLISEGLAFSIADFRVSKERAEAAISRQKEVFDGNSDKRILKLLNALDFRINSKMRSATAADMLTLLHWANEPELRRQSYNTNPIALEDHSRWFAKKLEDVNCYIFIFEYKNIPVAMVRIDVAAEATISYSLDKDFRGRGWGQLVLQNALEFWKSLGRSVTIQGFVKQSNISSNIIFKNLGFVQLPTDQYPDSYKYELKSHDGN